MQVVPTMVTKVEIDKRYTSSQQKSSIMKKQSEDPKARSQHRIFYTFSGEKCFTLENQGKWENI